MADYCAFLSLTHRSETGQAGLERVTYHRTGMGVGQKEPAPGGVAYVNHTPHALAPAPQNIYCYVHIALQGALEHGFLPTAG
jgi:hypothetical protein